MTRIPGGVAAIVDLEAIERNLFRSRVTHEGGPNVVYGGAVAAQALRAASHTVDDGALAHSLHAYFIRPGDVAAPVVYRVDIDRDGRSFLSRRVVAIQHGEVILNMVCSFHRPAEGIDYQARRLPQVEPPEELPDLPSRHWVAVHGMTVRVPTQVKDDLAFPSRFWIRNDLPLGDNPDEHACAVAYLSDIGSGLTLVPGVQPGTRMSTVDHSMWFYRPARADEWMFVDLTVESTASGRGMYSGRIFDRDGRLLTGLTQESLFLPPRAT